MSWIDALLMDYAAVKANQISPEYGLNLVGIERRSVYPTAKLEIGDEKFRTDALEAVTKAYEQALSTAEKDKEFLRMLFVEAMKSRSQFSIENVYAQNFLPGDKAQVFNITIEEFKMKITSVQKILESAPDTDFKGKGKQFALDTLSNILGNLGSEGIQKTAQKLLKTVIQCLGPVLAAQVMPFLQGLIH